MSVGVPPRAEQVEKEGDEGEHGEEPVEQVEAAGVKVCTVEPPMSMAAAAARGGVVDHLDEQATEPRRGAEDAEHDGAADGLHPGRRLAVEELEEPDEGGHVHDAQQEELRREPEHRHLGGAHAPAAAFHDGGDSERQDAGREPDAHALQVRDAAGVARGAAQPRHDRAVVDDQDDYLEDDGDDEEARRRDAGAAEAGVHGAALLHGQGEEQRDRDVAEDGAEEDGRHAQDDLGFLHLRHRAQ
ncbi:unnamed protein product [Urochloa decumbens]|uniref:Uncharacterized protein n=1 Tax=Urochloa decumbens TaxID=240449 RepID=A0ABC9GNY0_9POAL